MDKGIQGKEDYIRNLECIHDSAEKLVRIVNLLSTITNLKSDKVHIQPHELDLIELVKQETKEYQVRNKTNFNIRIVLNNKIANCTARVDGFWFKQLLSNLIMNAVNHCEKGLIEVRTDKVKKGEINYFCLSVSDEGCGIPEKELETIFKPMKRGSHSLKNNIPGSGIGLAIAHEIIEAHGGSIRALNNPKGGATFDVLIPL